MLDRKRLMRRWVGQEQAKGFCCAQIFVNVWRRLGYQWVDFQDANLWIQFVQDNRKYAPNVEFNKVHYKLLKIVLEECQNVWNCLIDWTEAKLRAMILLDSGHALGAKSHRDRVTSLVHFDIRNNTQRIMPIKYDWPIEFDVQPKVYLQSVDATLHLLIVESCGTRWNCHHFCMYLLSLNFNKYEATVVDNSGGGEKFNYIVVDPKVPRIFGIVHGTEDGKVEYQPIRIDDAGMHWFNNFDIDKNSMGYRVDDGMLKYICYDIDEGFMFREVPTESENRQNDSTTLYKIRSDPYLFDQSMTSSPYLWSNSNCYLTKQLKSDVDQFVICCFSQELRSIRNVGIQLTGKCLNLLMEETNVLLVCVKNKDRFSVLQFRLRQPEPLFNLSLLAVRRNSAYYANSQYEKLIEHLPDKMQFCRFDM